MRRGILYIALLLLTVSLASAAMTTKLSLQGEARTSSGDVISSGDLRVLVDDENSCSGSSPLLNQTYASAIVNSRFDELLTLSLNYNDDYYLCLYVNNEQVGGPYTFRGGQGEINTEDLADSSITGSDISTSTTLDIAGLDITDSSDSTSQVAIQGPASTTKLHLGQFSDGSYLFNNYFYNSGHTTDNSSLGSTGIIFDTAGIDFQYAAASATPSRQTAMKIDSSGNVGIGTTSPSEKLYIQDGNIMLNRNTATYGSNITLAAYPTGSGQQAGGINFHQLHGGGPGVVGRIEALWESGAADVYETSMVFSTRPDISSSVQERMRITSTGNVGIGTTSPIGKLHVAGAPGSIWLQNTAANGRSWRIGEEENAGKLTIYDNNATAYRMTIDSTGKVGIGTTSPGNTLEVKGSSNGGGITIRESDGGYDAINFSGYDSNGRIDIFSGGTGERIVLNPQGHSYFYGPGKLGIGTKSPGALLTINKSTASVTGDAMHLSLWDSSATTGNRIGISFSGNAVQARNRAGIWMESKTNGNEGDLVFATRFAEDGTQLQTTDEKMRITSGGKVGIGNTAPERNLEISNNGNEYAGARFSYFGTTGYSPYLEFVRSNSTTIDVESTTGDGDVLGVISFKGHNTGNQDWGGSVIRTIQDGPTVGSNVPASMELYTYGATWTNNNQLYLDTSGNIGIGTSDPGNGGFATGGKPTLHLKGTVPALSFEDTSDNHNWSIQAQDKFEIVDVDDSITRRFVIDAAGDVGIGTTNPAGRLEIHQGTDTDSYAGLVIDGTAQMTTRMYLNNTDFIINRGGTDVMAIQNDGNVGIGTNNPQVELHVNASTTPEIQLTEGGSSGRIRMVIDGGGDPEIQLRNSSGTNRAIIHSDGVSYFNGGNVGIGTTSPDQLLTVAGTSGAIRVERQDITRGNHARNIFLAGNGESDSDGLYYNVLLEENNSYDSWVEYMISGGGYGATAGRRAGMRWYTQGSGDVGHLRMTLTGDGELGIGTDSPSEILEVASSNPRVSVKDSDSSGSTATTGVIFLDSSGSRQGYVGDLSSANQHLYIGSDNGEILLENLASTYSGGSAYVCVYDSGVVYASESACP